MRGKYKQLDCFLAEKLHRDWENEYSFLQNQEGGVGIT